jgi:hypothetical protein
MDSKLNPISNTAAGIPLSGKSVTAGAGQQTDTNSKLKHETIRDTLETSDREADGHQAYQATNTDESEQPEIAESEPKPEGQGGLLDVEG